MHTQTPSIYLILSYSMLTDEFSLITLSAFLCLAFFPPSFSCSPLSLCSLTLYTLFFLCSLTLVLSHSFLSHSVLLLCFPQITDAMITVIRMNFPQVNTHFATPTHTTHAHATTEVKQTKGTHRPQTTHTHTHTHPSTTHTQMTLPEEETQLQGLYHNCFIGKNTINT